MKRIFLITLLSVITFMGTAQTKIRLTVGEKSVTATLAGNEATRTLVSLLEKAPITINMSDYGGFEKVGALPESLPTSNSQISTIPGDIMLYQGSNMVIFYGTNSWSYTPLGKIDGATAENVREFLGEGAISLTISLTGSGVDAISEEIESSGRIYDMNGTLISNHSLSNGLYIVNGKKKIFR